jgi:hypothetical protein
MKNFIYILLCSLIFISCKKEEKKHSVLYKIVVTSGHPAYSTSYSASNNTTKSESSLTSANWTSPQINDKKGGSSVYLTLTGGNGGSYKMYIYVDGNLEAEDTMYDPYGPKTISADVPED